MRTRALYISYKLKIMIHVFVSSHLDQFPVHLSNPEITVSPASTQ